MQFLIMLLIYLFIYVVVHNYNKSRGDIYL